MESSYTRPLDETVFYHIYALGALGAPRRNDGAPQPEPRLARLSGWMDAMERVGANALLLGPVFESESHGYDTLDLLSVDRRLGTNADLSAIGSGLGKRGMGLYLDAVLNHVGRGHPFVRDVADRGSASPYASWIAGYDPSGPGPGGLPFRYDGWKGHYDLVRLNTAREEVRDYLYGAALRWIGEFGLSGLRLDAADCLDYGFMAELGRRCRAARPGFILVGEAVHGDRYAPLLTEAGLDAVTNYEAYKALWSSYNDRNYHELAWTLDRLFSEPTSGAGNVAGLCLGRTLYSFADNHDVDRVASTVREAVGLYTLYALLFAMPGAPSLYYGSEHGVAGRKAPGDDGPLRPALDPATLPGEAPEPDLARAIARFASARAASPALRRGSYRRLAVLPEAIAFAREVEGELVAVAVNASASPLGMELPVGRDGTYVDLLDSGYRAEARGGRLSVAVPSHWTRWLRRG